MNKIRFVFCILILCNQIYCKLLDNISLDSFEYKYNIPEHTYHKFCKNIYSQNGEDGIIEQIIKELNIKNGTFCEFGASNGITSSNTFNLIKNFGFSGVAIELNEKLYQKCLENYKPFKNVKVFHGAVLYNDPNNDLNSWLKKGNLPNDFDILSIDIDCDDYYVWKNLTEFNPKIVILEINSYRDPIYKELPRNPSKEYNIDLLSLWYPQRIAMGCSFIAAIELGLKKNYIPIAFTGNIFFIRKDLVNNLIKFPYKISTDPYDYITLYNHVILWNNKWYTNIGLILNVALRDYYLKFKRKYVDINWLKVRMNEILNNINVIF